MLFNSVQFFIFFPVVTILYFLLPSRFRWIMLLVASCVFYMAFIPYYIFILFALIIIDYTCARLIEKNKGGKRKNLLRISILSTCSVLFLFKYFNFFSSNIAAFASFFHLQYPLHLLTLVLPIGLSFHTFQSLSYVIEVYKKRQKAERHLGIYALSVMFYPQLVAGPIERPQHMLHQFYEKHSFNYNNVTNGLKLMAWGLWKKLVIADRLAILVNIVYAHPQQYPGIPLIIATIFFAFQIYCDFSGYSDIARGAAEVMGFQLIINFNKPYFATSISDFWKRWHISLSSWLRDYIYIPLGGNRVSRNRWVRNILITFLISGLWHGANWTYICWGAIHGFYQIAEKFLQLPSKLQRMRVFILVCIAWIFFRSNTITDALYILDHLGTNLKIILQPRLFYSMVTGLGLSGWDLLLAAIGIGILHLADYSEKKKDIRKIIGTKPALFRWGIYYSLVISIILFGELNKIRFIYFQF